MTVCADAAGNFLHMHDLDLIILATGFFRQDPFRALGVMALACVAVSMTTNFDLARVLGFAEVEESRDGEATAS